MTGQELFQALSYVDERYIAEAQTRSLGVHIPWMKIISVAACLWFYEYFVFILLLGAPMMIVMTANLMMLPVFEEFFPEDENEEEI